MLSQSSFFGSLQNTVKLRTFLNIKYVSDIELKGSKDLIYNAFKCQDTEELRSLMMSYISDSIEKLGLQELVGKSKPTGLSQPIKEFVDRTKILQNSYA